MKTARHFWYCPHYTWPALLLLPLSYVFYGLVMLRYFLYRLKLLKSTQCPVPIVIVGNLTVGGTGKTPLVIWLANFLKGHGLRPGIVCRGVGGQKQTSPFWVTAQSDVSISGDEALLLAKRADCPVVVCIDRVAAVQALLAHTNCNVVLADDGLQHYRLARDIEIALVDSARGFGNGCLLPAGPLREPVSRLKRTDFVVEHDYQRQGPNTMQLYGDTLVSLTGAHRTIALHRFAVPCHAVAAIGHPARFFAMLRQQGLTIIEHCFPDHYLFQAADFNFADELPIIMTEKDAVKCTAFADGRFWYLPVSAKVDTTFAQKLLAKIQGHCHVS